MALPIEPLARGTVEINGQSVEFRALSRSEALKMGGFKGREDEAEVFVVSHGCDISTDEATTWLNSVGIEVAGRLIDGILVLSAMTKEGDADPKSPTSEP